MTHEDIIRIARHSGLSYSWVEAAGEALERFADLTAAAEREACIDLVAFYGGPVDLEAAIRARGNNMTT